MKLKTFLQWNVAITFIKRIAVVLFVTSLFPAAQAAPVFPVKYSANNRYLADQNGTPFPIMGRTAWFVTSLSVADYQTFVDDTAARGYNVIELHVINHDPRGNHPPLGGNGDRPFLNRLNGTSWNGALTYGNINNEAPDFTTPNAAYWSLVDGFLTYCESKGILVFMFPAYVGYAGGNQGWMQELVANGATKMQSYGAWIATRYKNQKNLVWMMGGDMGSFNTAQNNVESALLNGLKSVAGQQSVLFSAEWDSQSIATDELSFGGSMTLNGVYSWTGDVNSHGRRAYARSPVIPAFLLEEPYDEEGSDGNGANGSATQPVRRFQWWGWLSTIGGYVSGNGYIWPFPSTWRNHLNTQGTRDMTRLNAFMGSIAWYNLVPSGLNGMRTLITAGGSSVSASDYVTAAATPNGTLLVAYVPPAHNGAITVDMGAMGGPTRARWFDPTSAAYTDIGSGLANSGSRAFTPPGNNSVGATDWVLVLDNATGSTPATPTISDIANQLTTVNTATPAIPFTVGDAQTAAGSLTVSGSSGNPTLVPNGNIVFGGSGDNRTVTVSPAANQTGSATITVTVSDGSSSASDTFVLTVNPSSTPPSPGLEGTYFDNSDFTSPKLTRNDSTINFDWGNGSPDPAIGVDTFSVRWVGQIEPLYSQTYTFYALTDDGFRLWVNNQLLIDSWLVQSPTERASTPIALTAGTRYDLKIEYYENAGGAVAKLSWSSASQAKQIVPVGRFFPPPVTSPGGGTTPTISNIPNQTTTVNTATAAIPFTVADSDTSVNNLTLSKGTSNPTLVPANNIVFGGSGSSRTVTVTPAANQTGSATITVTVSDGSNNASDTFVLTVNPSSTPPSPGLEGTYFDNSDFTSPKLTRNDSTINFDWGNGSPDPAIGVDTFSVRWVGQIEPLYSQSYTFYALTDDGFRLWINNQLLIDSWLDQAPTERVSTPIALTAGARYDIKIEYYENAGGAVAKLSWSSASQAKQIVPAGRLFPPPVTSPGGSTTPTISNIPNQTTTVNTATAAIPFTVADSDTSVNNLTMSKGTSNPTLVPANNIVFGGSGSSRTVTVTPAANQTGTATITVTVSDGSSSASDTFVLTVNAVATGTVTASFNNTAAITIPDQGAATPYPSTINVSGLGGTINNVTVTLRNLSQTWASDVDVLLVGPGGQKVIVMSDAGNGNANNVTLTLSDAAAAALPALGLVSGTFKPTNLSDNSSGGDIYPSPAPAGPYAATLSAFNGQTASGTWSLYVFDDGPGDQGSFAGGWSLTLTTAGAAARSSVVVAEPTRITSIIIGDQGAVRVTVSGEVGLSYALEASSDSINWTKVEVQNNVTGSVVFNEQPTNAIRFYRAVSVPE